MILIRKAHLVAIAALALAGGARAANSGNVTRPSKDEIAPPTTSTDLQKLIDQFNAKRDSMLADRQQLLNQLKSATAEQRKEILEKMQQQQKDLLDAQRALGKQIRDDMRKLRQSVPGPGR